MRSALPRLLALVTLIALTGCRNDCVDLCQQYEVWLDDCGYGWSTAFPDEEWQSIEDCYDTHWDADGGELDQCAQESHNAQDLSCY